MELRAWVSSDLRETLRRVADMPDKSVERQTGDQIIDALKQKLTLKKPVLHFEKRKGKRTQRNIYDNNTQKPILRDLIEIHVPYEGDRTHLILKPTALKHPCTWEADESEVWIALPDDENLEVAFEDEFAKLIENIDAFEVELKSETHKAMALLTARFDERLEQVEKRRKLDSSRSFPIE